MDSLLELLVCQTAIDEVSWGVGPSTVEFSNAMSAKLRGEGLKQAIAF
jgi:hypothetical protein